MGVFFLVWLGGVFWLSLWAVRVNRDPKTYMHKGPFGIRSGEELHKIYGKKMPF